MQFDHTAFLKQAPTLPGCYQMFNQDGHVIYVGKAKNLKNRLTSYFRKNLDSPKTKILMSHVTNIEYTVTASENEALLLEINLIKKHRPRYNIYLRDDKSYPFLRLSAHEFPALGVYRGKRSDKAEYFGPYPSGLAVRETLNLMQKIFKIRSCSDSFFNARTRPCLQYQIKRCTAPCVNFIKQQDYATYVKRAKLFLQGKSDHLINELINAMENASGALDYEQAAIYRDQIASLRKVQEQQNITKQRGDIDVIALSLEQNIACIHVLYIRDGRILGSKSHFPKMPQGASAEEIYTAFLPQYYLNQVRVEQIPKQIICNINIPETELISSVLAEACSHKVALTSSVRGERLQWRKMSEQNAKLALQRHLSDKANMYQRYEALAKLLELENIPTRMECFDISHSSGEATVASCVVFDENGPQNSSYRRFNIKDITAGDDYAAMRQALTRRYKSIKEKDGLLPDVLFIDGGKGQLTQAREVFESLQIDAVLLVGIAKGPDRKPGLETLFFNGHMDGLNVKTDSPGLHLMQHIRDEAHRFAITGHRARRDKKRRISTLEQIDGVGAKRRRALINRFGGLQEIKSASVIELAKVPGINEALARKIYDALH